MIIESINEIFQRDLKKLKGEMSRYTSEDKMWNVDKEITNSAGNLCYHLIGNLNHFIGAVLGNTGYVRQRDLEFSSKDIPLVQLLKDIDEVSGIIETTLSNIDVSELEEEYPIQVFKAKMTKGYFLVHLASHLNYHLGQINYHRRLLDA